MAVLRFSSSLVAARRSTNAGSKSLVACAKLRRTQPSLGVAPTIGRLSFACPASFNVILVTASTCFYCSPFEKSSNAFSKIRMHPEAAVRKIWPIV